MPAVTQVGLNRYSTMGDRNMVTAEFTSPLDADTWDTGLAVIDAVVFTIVEASGAAADAISVGSISGKTVTLDVQGTVDSARAWAIGV